MTRYGEGHSYPVYTLVYWHGHHIPSYPIMIGNPGRMGYESLEVYQSLRIASRLFHPSYFSGLILPGWWFGTFIIFPYIGNVIIPTDFHIFQRGSNHEPSTKIPLKTLGICYLLMIHQVSPTPRPPSGTSDSSAAPAASGGAAKNKKKRGG